MIRTDELQITDRTTQLKSKILQGQSSKEFNNVWSTVVQFWRIRERYNKNQLTRNSKV